MTSGPAIRGDQGGGLVRRVVARARGRSAAIARLDDGTRLADLFAAAQADAEAGDIDERRLRILRSLQALQQERDVFRHRIEQDHALFRIEHAMGWSMFALLLVTPALSAVAPPAAVAVAPAAAAATWYWRRMLRRDREAPAPVTREPETI